MQFLFTYQVEQDFLAEAGPLAFYSNLEEALGIIAACIATIRPLFQLLLSLRGNITSRGNDESPPNSITLRRLTNRTGQPVQPESLEGLSRQVRILPLLSLNRSTDNQEHTVHMSRQESLEGLELIAHTLT